MNAGVYHAVAVCAQAEIGIDVCPGFDITFSVLVGILRFSAGYVAEKRKFYFFYGTETVTGEIEGFGREFLFDGIFAASDKIINRYIIMICEHYKGFGIRFSKFLFIVDICCIWQSEFRGGFSHCFSAFFSQIFKSQNVTSDNGSIHIIHKMSNFVNM